MKTKYTKKQIQESIKHWQKVLESMNEARTRNGDTIYSDQVPGDDNVILNSDELATISIDAWKADKIYATEKLLNVRQKCKNGYLNI